ncbi:MAG: flagellar hook-basal body complex protein FliE [Alphaproteobacteria bacterium]|nr:flagellar hook-basal body complex protein FliE [Alphaproteobacteria bacterium]
MVDKIVNPAAINAYANTSKAANVAGLNAPQKGESFGDILKSTAMRTLDTLRGGEVASAKAVSGEASLPEVVQAITAAEVTLQTVVAVRDRLVGAYQEIMRMPV